MDQVDRKKFVLGGVNENNNKNPDKSMAPCTKFYTIISSPRLS